MALSSKALQQKRTKKAAKRKGAKKSGTASNSDLIAMGMIAAAFCMYNRYVDGLGTDQPQDEAMYRERGKRVARDGYVTVSEEYLGAHAHTAL